MLLLAVLLEESVEGHQLVRRQSENGRLRDESRIEGRGLDQRREGMPILCIEEIPR
ncbi:hypothetical protein D3C83_245460 [compost metagenome]